MLLNKLHFIHKWRGQSSKVWLLNSNLWVALVKIKDRNSLLHEKQCWCIMQHNCIFSKLASRSMLVSATIAKFQKIYWKRQHILHGWSWQASATSFGCILDGVTRSSSKCCCGTVPPCLPQNQEVVLNLLQQYSASLIVTLSMICAVREPKRTKMR